MPVFVDDWKKVLEELHFENLVVKNLTKYTEFKNARKYYFLILVVGLIFSFLFIIPFAYYEDVQNKLFSGYLIYFFLFIVGLSFYLISSAFFISKKHRVCFFIALVAYLFLCLAIFFTPDFSNKKILYDSFDYSQIFIFFWLVVIVIIGAKEIFSENMPSLSLSVFVLTYFFVFFMAIMFFIISLNFEDGINLDFYRALIVSGANILPNLHASLALLLILFFYIFSRKTLFFLVFKKIKLLFKNHDSNEFLKDKNDNFLITRLQTYYIVSFLRSKNALKIEVINLLLTRNKLYLSLVWFHLYKFMPVGIAVFFLIDHLDSFMLEHIFNKENLFNESFFNWFAKGYVAFVVITISTLFFLFLFGFLTPSKSVLDDILLELTTDENSKFNDLEVDEDKIYFFWDSKESKKELKKCTLKNLHLNILEKINAFLILLKKRIKCLISQIK